MNTVILKWNPGISSFKMVEYLHSILAANLHFSDEDNKPIEAGPADWSIWDYEKVKRGDIFYLLKVGYGASGIVGKGVVASDCEEDEDWSGKGRKVYYAYLKSDFLINPDALPVLKMKDLEEKIPGFDWGKAHAGTVMSNEDAKKLETMWHKFVDENESLFKERMQNSPDILYFRDITDKLFAFTDESRHPMQSNFTFIFERDVFQNGDVLFDAVVASGKKWIAWNDDLLAEENRDVLSNAIFHGSLEIAKKISDFINDYNTSFFDADDYWECLYDIDADYFLNQDVETMTIRQACDGKKTLKKVCNENGDFFARPKSCLKEFSGRVLNKNNLTPAHFDYGFYHNNMELEIECSPIKPIEEEYRFVVVNGKIITGSIYLGDGRKALNTIVGEKSRRYRGRPEKPSADFALPP